MAKPRTIDKLIVTLIFSIIAHIVVVMGVSFDVFTPAEKPPVKQLDITLVQQKDRIEPAQADWLAQANNEADGELETTTPEPEPAQVVPEIEPVVPPVESLTPAEPEPTVMPEPSPEPKVEPQPELEPEPEPAPKTPTPVEPVKAEKPTPPKPAEPEKKLTQPKAEREVVSAPKPKLAPKPEPKPDPVAKPAEPKTPKLSARDLMSQAHSEINTVQNQLDKNAQSLSEQTKKRRISAATKEYAAAAYMKAWEMKVERIGNMNYPEEARRKNLSGTLMLSVDIHPDGSVPADGIVISRSSGIEALDQAAVKIVRMGAPYSEIPDNVLQGNDMLTIIRTWKFETGRGGLSAR